MPRVFFGLFVKERGKLHDVVGEGARLQVVLVLDDERCLDPAPDLLGHPVGALLRRSCIWAGSRTPVWTVFMDAPV